MRRLPDRWPAAASLYRLATRRPGQGLRRGRASPSHATLRGARAAAPEECRALSDGLGANFLQPPRDDRILARLQHPDADHQRVLVGLQPGARTTARLGIQLDAGRALPQFTGDLEPFHLDLRRI